MGKDFIDATNFLARADQGRDHIVLIMRRQYISIAPVDDGSRVLVETIAQKSTVGIKSFSAKFGYNLILAVNNASNFAVITSVESMRNATVDDCLVSNVLSVVAEGRPDQVPGALTLSFSSELAWLDIFEDGTTSTTMLLVVLVTGICHVWVEIPHSQRNSAESPWAYFTQLSFPATVITHFHYNAQTHDVVYVDQSYDSVDDRRCSNLQLCSLYFASDSRVQLSTSITAATFNATIQRVHCALEGIWISCEDGAISYYDYATGRIYHCEYKLRSVGVNSGALVSTTAVLTTPVTRDEAHLPLLCVIAGAQLHVYAVDSRSTVHQMCCYDVSRVLARCGRGGVRGNRGQSHRIHDIIVLPADTEENAAVEMLLGLLTSAQLLFLPLPPLPIGARCPALGAPVVPLHRYVAYPLPKPSRKQFRQQNFPRRWRFVRDDDGSDEHSVVRLTDGLRQYCVRIGSGGAGPESPKKYESNEAGSIGEAVSQVKALLSLFPAPRAPPPPSVSTVKPAYVAPTSTDAPSFLRQLRSRQTSATAMEPVGPVVAAMCAGASDGKLDTAMLTWFASSARRVGQNGEDLVLSGGVLSVESVLAIAAQLEADTPIETPQVSDSSTSPLSPPTASVAMAREGNVTLAGSRIHSAASVGECCTASALKRLGDSLDPWLLSTLTDAVARLSDEIGDVKNEQKETILHRPSMHEQEVIQFCILQLTLRVLFYLHPESFLDVVAFLQRQQGRNRKLDEPPHRQQRSANTQPTSDGPHSNKTHSAPAALRTVSAAPPLLPQPLQLSPPHGHQIDEDDDEIFGLSAKLLQPQPTTFVPEVSKFVPQRHGLRLRNLSTTTYHRADGGIWEARREKTGHHHQQHTHNRGHHAGDRGDTDSGDDEDDHDQFGIFRDVGEDSSSDEDVNTGNKNQGDSHDSSARAAEQPSLRLEQRLWNAVEVLLPASVPPVPTAQPPKTLQQCVALMALHISSSWSSYATVWTAAHRACLCQMLLQAQQPAQTAAFLALCPDLPQLEQLCSQLCAQVSATTDSAYAADANVPFRPLRRGRSLEGLSGPSEWDMLMTYLTSTTESLVAESLRALVHKLTAAERGGGLGLTALQVGVVEAVVVMKITIRAMLSAPQNTGEDWTRVVQLVRQRPPLLPLEAVRSWVTVFATSAEQRRLILCSDVFLP